MLRNLLATTVTPTSPLPSCVQEHSLPDPRPTSLKHKATDRIRITIPGPIFTAAPLSLRSGQGQNVLLGQSAPRLERAVHRPPPALGRVPTSRGILSLTRAWTRLSIEQAWQWGSAATPGIRPAPAMPVTCSGPGYFYPRVAEEMSF